MASLPCQIPKRKRKSNLLSTQPNSVRPEPRHLEPSREAVLDTTQLLTVVIIVITGGGGGEAAPVAAPRRRQRQRGEATRDAIAQRRGRAQRVER